jgi:uncharacterized protein (TIGR01777 family)
MKILITGSTGLIGSALVPALTRDGHEIIRLVRSRERDMADAIYWRPSAGEIDREYLEGFDAVIHLAGKNLSAGRWNKKLKKQIYDSRTNGTRLLADTLANLVEKPSVLISANAVGYYGDRGDDILTENDPPGEGFLPDVCKAWQDGLQPAKKAGIRTVVLRIAPVISARGGALAKMLPVFKLGLGGKLGSGRQYMSWVALDDITEIVRLALEDSSLQGPINATSPHPVTNYEFTKTLGRVLHRPTIFPVPAFALRLLFGQLADEGLLASQRVHPAKLLDHGYEFRYPNLGEALRSTLEKPT